MSEENTQEQPPGSSFGRRFSTARGALNLSREQVAKELKLGIEIVIALEEEDYENLGAPIFVTGYIRNYARILNLPVDPLLAAYSQVQIETPTLVASSVSKPGRHYGSLIIKLVTVVILLVVIAGIVSWFQSQDFQPGTWFDTPETQPTVTLPGLSEPDTLPAEEASQPEANDVNIIDPASVPKPEATPSTQDTTVSALPVAEPEITAEAEPEPPVIAKPEAASRNTVLLRLSQDSWVDIQDNTGKRLIYDLLRAGTQRQLSGQPPYKVFLGNAKGVKIEYNGEPIDIEKHRKGNLARFTFGKAQE